MIPDPFIIEVPPTLRTELYPVPTLKELKVLLVTGVTLGRLTVFKIFPAPEVTIVPVGLIDRPFTVVVPTEVALALVKVKLARLEPFPLNNEFDIRRTLPLVMDEVKVSPLKVGVAVELMS